MSFIEELFYGNLDPQSRPAVRRAVSPALSPPLMSWRTPSPKGFRARTSDCMQDLFPGLQT